MKIKHRKNGGFTLMEMLIVVAIIAVLVAIAIPTFSGSLHKAKVAADEANIRAYYAELQMDYLLNDRYDPAIGPDLTGYPNTSITFADGNTVNLTGSFFVRHAADRVENWRGYYIYYECDKGDCTLILGGP